MVMKDRLTTAFLIATVLVLMLAASAEAQMAKEGDLSGTHSMSGTFKATKIGDDFLLVTSERKSSPIFVALNVPLIECVPERSPSFAIWDTLDERNVQGDENRRRLSSCH